MPALHPSLGTEATPAWAMKLPHTMQMHFPHAIIVVGLPHCPKQSATWMMHQAPFGFCSNQPGRLLNIGKSLLMEEGVGKAKDQPASLEIAQETCAWKTGLYSWGGLI